MIFGTLSSHGLALSFAPELARSVHRLATMISRVFGRTAATSIGAALAALTIGGCAASAEEDAPGGASAVAATTSVPLVRCDGTFNANLVTDALAETQSFDLELAPSTSATFRLATRGEVFSVHATSLLGREETVDSKPSAPKMPVLANIDSAPHTYHVKVDRDSSATSRFRVQCAPIVRDAATPSGLSDEHVCVAGESCSARGAGAGVCNALLFPDLSDPAQGGVSTGVCFAR